MNQNATVTGEFGRFIQFLIQEMKPRGPWLTPFNIISIPVILTGVVVLYYRFRYGLGAVTNLSQENAWGFWLGFDVVTGIALAGGAYVITFVVYVMKVDKYHSIVRVTVLNGLLAYIFYGGALLFDLGRPWHAMNPYIGNSFGFSSVMFLICWHFMLYMVAEFIEFSPVIMEWAGLGKSTQNSQKHYPRYGYPGDNIIDAASIRPRGFVSDGQAQNSSTVVVGVYSGPVFCFQHLCGFGHDYLRGNHKP